MVAQYAKAIVTAIGVGLTLAITYYPHASWIAIASAVVTALATYAVPNAKKPPTSLPNCYQSSGPDSCLRRGRFDIIKLVVRVSRTGGHMEAPNERHSQDRKERDCGRG